MPVGDLEEPHKLSVGKRASLAASVERLVESVDPLAESREIGFLLAGEPIREGDGFLADRVA